VNPKSTSNQSSKPCTVLQYPSRRGREEWAESARVLGINKALPAAHCNIIYKSAAHCTTLIHSATHRNTLQHTALAHRQASQKSQTEDYRTNQHVATCCTTLRHTAPHCNTLQHAATHCTALQHTTLQCNTLHLHIGEHLRNLRRQTITQVVWLCILLHITHTLQLSAPPNFCISKISHVPHMNRNTRNFNYSARF